MKLALCASLLGLFVVTHGASTSPSLAPTLSQFRAADDTNITSVRRELPHYKDYDYDYKYKLKECEYDCDKDEGKRMVWFSTFPSDFFSQTVLTGFCALTSISVSSSTTDTTRERHTATRTTSLERASTRIAAVTRKSATIRTRFTITRTVDTDTCNKKNKRVEKYLNYLHFSYY